MYGTGHARVLHLSSRALGALRRDLIKALGTERAKGFLLRYGWSIGQEDAASLQAEPGLSPLEWLQAGLRLHTEAQMATARTEVIRMDRERREFYMEGFWDSSYEAQEHLRHFGPARDPVCWTLVGYAGGYASTVFGERVIFREVACVARGDEACRFVGMPESHWGLRAPRELHLYESQSLMEDLETAHQRIRRQNDQLQHVISVHDQLTHVVMRGAGLSGIAETLGRLLGCTVAIEDRHLRTLAICDSRGDQGANGDAPATLSAIVSRRQDLRKSFLRLQRERRTVFLPARKGEWGDLVVAPILLDEDLAGFLTMSVVEGLSAELTRMVAERTALACALEMLRERTALEVEQRLRGDFLDHLLTAGADAAFLERWAHHLGLGLGESPHRFFLVQPERQGDGTQGWLPSDQDRLHRRYQEVLEAHGIRGIGVPRAGALVALLSCSTPQVDPLADELRRRAEEEQLPVWIGVSRPFLGAASALAAYEECRSILGAMREGGAARRIVRVDEVGALQLLFRYGGRSELGGFAQERLAPLLEYDAIHQSDLVPTLRHFLENAGNHQATAERLNISVSGLKYRLQRIREVGGLDLSDPEVRFDLMVALRVLSLLGHRSIVKNGKID